VDVRLLPDHCAVKVRIIARDNLKGFHGQPHDSLSIGLASHVKVQLLIATSFRFDGLDTLRLLFRVSAVFYVCASSTRLGRF